MSNMKCPFCQQELKIAGEHTTIMSCFNGDCKGSGLYGEKAFWQALIQAKQDLEIARKALKVYSSDSGNWWYGYEFQGLYEDYAGEYADKALEQIEHKE